MKQVTFGFHDMHRHGAAFYDFLVLRKRFFVDTLGWNIPHNAVAEMDQYDNPEARYSIVLQNGEVIGGARIMPFSVRWGQHGCMLTDAAAGKIDGIPSAALPDLTLYRKPWECTRLVLADNLRTNAERTRCLAMVVEGLVSISLAHGAEELVTLTVPSLRRVLRGLGYDVNTQGDVFANQDDGRRYCVLSMPARHVSKGGNDQTFQEAGAGAAQ